MKLYDFLFEKGVLRKFKRNWLRYRYYHRAPKPTQDKMFNDWLDKMFNDWLELWGENPYAIRMAFRWSLAKYGKDKYWSRIDSEWRMYLTNKNSDG